MRTPTEPDTMTRLVQSDDAPYDFAEFQQRALSKNVARARIATRSWRALRIAAVVAPVSLLVTIVTVVRSPPAPVTEAPFAAVAEFESSEPALVEAGALASVGDLEDRIAWIDTMLSDARAGEDRRALQDGRRAIVDSLQQVRYAQTVLSY
ncbi:MAG: hypothetical protein ABW136_11560 [Steroidobacteraceae bacterium]